MKKLSISLFSGGGSLAALLLAPFAVLAATAPAQAQNQSQTPPVKVELNKIEPVEGGCRAYLVIDNQSPTAFSAFKLDIVMFQTDGIIGKRFALDLAPLKPVKRSIKLFDLDGVQCEAIGSFLVNDVIDCKTAGSGAPDECFARLVMSSLGKVTITK